jgi:methionyl-tRNA formyltransferase
VVTQPDRPRGRGQKLTPSPVKEVALKHGLPLEQPEKLKGDRVFHSLIQSLNADLAVVVAYGQLIPKDLLDLLPHGFINLHASLLPAYRGAAPIQWALLNGERESGLTIFRLVPQLDAGPILSQRKVAISEEDNAVTLSHKIFSGAPDLLRQALQQIESGQAHYREQEEKLVSQAPLLTPESGEIDWKKSARQVHDRIRALAAWPVAHTFFRGRRLRLFGSRIVEQEPGQTVQPGEIVSLVKKIGFVVATGEGFLLLDQLQIEGGKRLNAFDFALGHDVKIGETLPN